jgi:glycosyltransferase involved in cell wall biosynthesis
VVTSEREADAFVDLGGPDTRDRMAVVPNGVDTEFFRPADRRDQRAVVFTGKLSYHANAAAALRLVERIMPLVWARRPETPVVLVGKGPSAQVRALGKDARVNVTGYVDDMRPFFADAVVAVCPLVYGVGIQNKALEALASGVATIVTPAVARALQGTPGEHYLTAEDDQEVADTIGDVLSRPGLRRRLESAGREYVTAHHRWRALATSLVETYQAAMRM